MRCILYFIVPFRFFFGGVKKHFFGIKKYLLFSVYILQQREQHFYFYKKANQDIIEGLQMSFSPLQKELLFFINSLQNSVLQEKYLKKGVSVQEFYKNKEKKRYIQQQIEEKTHQILDIIV